MPGPNNEVDLTKFFRKVNEFWYNEANNEENNEVILGQFSGFWGLWRRVEWSKTSKISQISNLNVLNIVLLVASKVRNATMGRKFDLGF